MTRRFKLYLLDNTVLEGVEFSSGHVAVNHPDPTRYSSVFTVAESVDSLGNDIYPESPLYNSRLEWIDSKENDVSPESPLNNARLEWIDSLGNDIYPESPLYNARLESVDSKE
jgi:hypothetical protein